MQDGRGPVNVPLTSGLYVAGVDQGSSYCVPYYSNPGSSVGLAVGSGVLAILLPD